MVRIEAVITALFGATLGIGLATMLGWTVVASLAGEGPGTLVIPGMQLGVWLAVAATAGMVAAIGPARSAARLDVLTAIADE